MASMKEITKKGKKKKKKFPSIVKSIFILWNKIDEKETRMKMENNGNFFTKKDSLKFIKSSSFAKIFKIFKKNS